MNADTTQITMDEITKKYAKNTPIILTVGNLGYTPLLVNWWLSINKNTDMVKDTLIMTYDEHLVSNIKKKIPLCNIYHIPYRIQTSQGAKNININSKATSFKSNGWDEITRFKLKAIHHLLNEGYTVFYVDPDVCILNNSLNELKTSIDKNKKMLIQQGKPFCSGVIYAPYNDITMNLFDPKEWLYCHTDDENYIIQYFYKKYPELLKYISILDLEHYPNGLKWSKEYTPTYVKELMLKKKIKLLHFNYISGIQNKINRMKQYGMWYKQMNIINVPDKFQSDLNNICIKKQKGIYPPHQSGLQIESYMYKYISDKMASDVITSDYDYLPICWTSIIVNNDRRLINELTNWIKNFIKKNPLRKCWTIVQHCKGIQNPCNLTLPSHWIVFATSNPNAIYNPSMSIDKHVPTITNMTHESDNNKHNIHSIKKTMYWHGTGFGRKTPYPPKKKSNSAYNKNMYKKNLLQKPDIKCNIKNHITIPLLSSEHYNCNHAQSDGKRDLLASFIGDIAIHDLRIEMKNILQHEKRVIIEYGNYKKHENKKKFESLMSTSTFALCPRGFGNTSFRLVEALQFGTIPVYISDIFSLPYKDKINWDKIALIITSKELPTLYSKLLKIESDQALLNSYKNEIKKVYNQYFTMSGCCNYIISYLKNI